MRRFPREHQEWCEANHGHYFPIAKDPALVYHAPEEVWTELERGLPIPPPRKASKRPKEQASGSK